jgi:putative oxidoreductase
MKSLLHCTCADTWKDGLYAVLRVVTGLIFFVHGYSKVFGMGMDGVTGFFASAGIPLASLFALLVSYGELLGGLALIIGFLSHWVAKANVLIMLGAIWFVHLQNGFSMGDNGYEYALMLLAVNLYIMAAGSGKYSVDAHMKEKNAGMGQMGGNSTPNQSM